MKTRSCAKCSLMMKRCDFKYCPDCGEKLESLCPSDATPYSPIFSVDYGLICKVMESIEHLGDDSDSDCACRRVYCRMLAEATGMPLAGHRLLMEKEVRPKYRKDYALAPNFQENANNPSAPR